jgi:hypothetical protein
MGVALLLAAVFGILLVALPGTAASCSFGCSATAVPLMSQLRP